MKKKNKAILIIIAIVVPLVMMLGTVAVAEGAAEPAPLAVDLTPFLQALVGLLASLITAKVIPWIKARTTAQQQETLQAATRTAVYAAEQIYAAGHGDEKLQYVKGVLANRGYSVDLAVVEAAVREMNINDWFLKQQEPPDNPDNPA